MKLKYKVGQPCDHPGCMNHVSHPCEGCGRFQAMGTVYESEIVWDEQRGPQEPKSI